MWYSSTSTSSLNIFQRVSQRSVNYMTDQSKASLAAAGDKIALIWLLTESRLRLRLYIFRQIPLDLARVVDAEDIVQEAQTEVFRRIQSFEVRGPDSFFRFTAAIAVNLLRNTIKKQRTAKRGGGRLAVAHQNLENSTLAFFDLLGDSQHSPSRSVARHEAIDAVNRVIDQLPDHYRKAVRLVHIEGRSVREVAAEMNRTERAIQGLCRRAIKIMSANLADAANFFSSAG